MPKKLTRAKRKQLGLHKPPPKADVEALVASVGRHDDDRDEPRPTEEIEQARQERAAKTVAHGKKTRDRTLLVVLGLLVFATVFAYFAPSLWKSTSATAPSAEPSAAAPPGIVTGPLMTSTARVLQPKKETGSAP